MTLTILSILPDLLNVNGDAENARVLAQRASWSEIGARIVTHATVRPDLVVIGSGVDAMLGVLASALVAQADSLRGWLSDGTAILAVGTGFELLSEGVQLSPEEWLTGIAIFPGRSVHAATRVSDDLVVSSRFGRLVGYENHARDYRLAAGAGDAGALGTVLYGRGNGPGGRAEGAAQGTAFGTHLHGPVLAKNPAFAYHLLAIAAGQAYSAGNERAARVDEIARAARNQIAMRLNLGTEAQLPVQER